MQVTKTWRRQLRFDPLTPLLNSGDQALVYFTRRDLLAEEVGPVAAIWESPPSQKILQQQQPDGSWPYRGSRRVSYPVHHYPLLETWKQFRFLVEMFEMKREQPQVAKAAEFLYSCQTPEGDFRGFIGNQYAPYYTGAVMFLLIKAGYADDPRIHRGFQWLLRMRQNDGGWIIPIFAAPLDRGTKHRMMSEYSEPLEPDRTKPFSHNCTGMAIRAFAVHPEHRHSQEARLAGSLLKSRFFKKDKYSSYQGAGYWVIFQYPYWWNNLLASLDSLAGLGFRKEDGEIAGALRWFIENQEKNGLWRISYAKERQAVHGSKSREQRLWISLAICRMLQRFFG